MARRAGRHSRGTHATPGAPDGATSAHAPTTPSVAPGTDVAELTATAPLALLDPPRPTGSDGSPWAESPTAEAPGIEAPGIQAPGIDAPVAEAAPVPVVPNVVVPAPVILGGSPPAPQDAVLPTRAHRARWLVPVVVVSVVAAAAVAQLARPVPLPSWHGTLQVATPVTGSAPVLPWPATGEAAVAVPALGVMIESGPEPAVPIASLAKLMTAYLTLHDHPLPLGDDGPALQITAADQSEAQAEASVGATNVPVEAGEALSERQLLDGLMVHSANNLADVLARWDAGTVPAFVAKMNATATALGMTHTHYADASGLDPGTSGNAVDQLRVTEAAMAIPTFAAVVAQRSVTLPVAGALPNYVQSVGSDGIVGVKSGFTQAAMGCLVLAGDRTVAGRPVLVLAVVTGQPGAEPLQAANVADVHLIDAVASGLRTVDVVARGTQVGTVTVPWSPRRVAAVASRTASFVAWPGLPVRVQVSRVGLRPRLTPGERIGTMSVSVGDQRAEVPVRVTGGLRGPSVRWRLARR